MRASRIGTVLPVVLVALVAMLVSGTPVMADPGDDEGSATSARKKLESAARQYNNARGRLKESTRRRTALTRRIAAEQRRIEPLRNAVGRIAAQQYRSGPSAGILVMAMDDGSQDFLRAAGTLDYLARRDANTIRTLQAAQRRQRADRADLNETIERQRKQVADLKKRKAAAQRAYNRIAGPSSPGYTGGAVTAEPAPRNPDGSWPPESCSVDDPTTDGCLTPRTLHAYQEARKAGFTRYTACYRPVEDGGEHPRGRACDFSVTEDGFGGESCCEAREYGNRLAAWFIANADRLGVLYVIFFRQIWMPGQGWSAYSGSGSPSAEHTNHVHLSVQ